jgi:peptidoglycan hydrolase FlgJ
MNPIAALLTAPAPPGPLAIATRAPGRAMTAAAPPTPATPPVATLAEATDFLNRLRRHPDGSASATPALDVTVLSPPQQAEWDLLDTLPPRGFPLERRPSALAYTDQDVSAAQLQQLPDSAQQAMQQFVGETFYGMLLKQMRNTVVESDLMGNSSAKKMFQSQLDQTLVQELALHHSEFLSHPIRI